MRSLPGILVVLLAVVGWVVLWMHKLMGVF